MRVSTPPSSARAIAMPAPIAVDHPRTLAALFAALLLAALWPILTTPVAPLADYVNHLARMRILADIADDPALAGVYTVKWALIPNLIMDLVVPRLAGLIGVYPAGQLYLVALVALLTGGPMVLYRALHGHWSPWPLAVVPFVYNGIFLFGLVNYLFGVGVAIWGAAAWIALADRPVVWRMALAGILVVPVLFVCHLFAVGLFGMTIGAFELARLFERDRIDARAVIAGPGPVLVPFASVPVGLWLSPTLGLANQMEWESVGKLDGLGYVIQTYSDLPDLAAAGLICGAMVWLARRGRLRLHPAGLVLLAGSLLVYLAMPRMLFGSWIADQRLPVAVAFLAVGFARMSPRSPRSSMVLAMAVLSAGLIRFGDVTHHWRALGAEMEGFRQSVAMLPKGARILVARADDPTPAEDSHEAAAISHAPCVAVIDRDAVVSTLFSVPGKQILDLKPEYRGLVDAEDGDPPTVSQLLATAEDPIPGQSKYWDRWAGRYEYLYILHTDPSDTFNPDPDHLNALRRGEHFQLYAVHPAPEEVEPLGGDMTDDDAEGSGLEAAEMVR